MIFLGGSPRIMGLGTGLKLSNPEAYHTSGLTDQIEVRQDLKMRFGMSRSICQANQTNQRPRIVARNMQYKRSRTGETRIAVDISVSAKRLRGDDILNQQKMNNSIQCQSTPKKLNYLQKGYPHTHRPPQYPNHTPQYPKTRYSLRYETLFPHGPIR
jgi:hypothetical protein